MHEAGYFHTISQSSKVTVNFVQISEKAVMSSAMKQIADLEPEVIVMYTTKEKTELLLQKVTGIGFHSF